MVKEASNQEDTKSFVSYPANLSKLISVRNKVVFVRTTDSSFNAKLTVTNKSDNYVTYVVRPSDRNKFKIKNRYGFLPPRESIQVLLVTKRVTTFQEIATEYFGVFAIPVYDKRLLEKNTLNLLWRAQGTKMFPYEAAEFHRVSYVLPKSDNYLNELPLVGRIANMSHISRRSLPKDGSDIAFDENPVDEETFFLNWPPPIDNISEDETMQLLTRDWNQLTSKINSQTQNILDGLKTLFGMGLSSATTLIAMYYLHSSNAPPFGFGLVDDNSFASSDTEKIPEVTTTEENQGWLSWTGLF